ncbi:polyketide synthase dehydratase domain-containing protein [Kitasatospora aburaviensis]
MDIDGMYERLAEAGLEYGPIFQGLRAVWRTDKEVFAELALPNAPASSHGRRADAGAFGLHPALLDAALHAVGFGPFLSEAERASGQARLPFSWGGVTLHAAGAAELRVRLSPAGENAVRLAVTDALGAPVASVES